MAGCVGLVSDRRRARPAARVIAPRPVRVLDATARRRGAALRWAVRVRDVPGRPAASHVLLLPADGWRVRPDGAETQIARCSDCMARFLVRVRVAPGLFRID